MTKDSKKAPLTMDGKVIGHARLVNGKIEAEITDEEAAAKIKGLLKPPSYSISCKTGEVQVKNDCCCGTKFACPTHGPWDEF
jgi:hypothetical protein